MNLLTPEQARQRLGLGRNTIYSLLRNGSLRAVRIGRAIRISDVEIERFIAQGGSPNDKCRATITPGRSEVGTRG